MLNIRLLLIIFLTNSFVLAINECNRTHPDYDDNSCRKLWRSENRLHKFLLKNYNKDVRPAMRSNATNIKIDLLVREVSNTVRDESQKIAVHAWLKMTWNDEFLKWHPIDYNRQSSIKLPNNLIWTPDITLYNGVETTTPFDLKVESNGNVTWVVPKDLSVKCILNFKFFPFDEQSCSFVFGSWVYNSHELDVHRAQDSVNTVYYQESREWSIESTNVIKETKIYGNNLSYPSIKFTLNLSRNYLNYALLIMLPVTFLSVFSMLVFLFPVQTYVTRFVLALVILIGFFTIALYIQVRTAKITCFADNLSLLSIYCFVMILVVALELFFVILLANFDGSAGQLPSLLRTTLCKSCISNEEENEWKSIASYLDKFLFVLFLVLIVVIISIFFVLFVFL